METVKSFVTLDNIATIKCPKCHKTKNVAGGKYLHRKHTLKVQCSCHHSFFVLLDFRKHFRKELDLVGTFSLMAPAFGTGKLNVINMSRNGICFSTGNSALSNREMTLGQKARVNFVLDNKKNTPIDKVITIRSVRSHFIGGEFEHTHALEKDLGFYLQP